MLGGTGFLGRHIVPLAGEAGYEVESLSQRERCDLTDLECFTSRLHRLKPDVVINCAAHVGSLHYVTRRAADVVHDNMQIILNLYRGVQQACPRAMIINPISNCSYPGNADTQAEPEWLAGPVRDSFLAYANPRRRIHVMTGCYWRQYGLRSVNWLAANAYGPGDYSDPDKVHALNGISTRLIKTRQFRCHGVNRQTACRR